MSAKTISSISTTVVAAVCYVPLHRFVQSKVHCFIGVCPSRNVYRGSRAVIWLHAPPEVSESRVSTGSFRRFRVHDLYGAERVVCSCLSTHLQSLQVRKETGVPFIACGHLPGGQWHCRHHVRHTVRTREEGIDSIIRCDMSRHHGAVNIGLIRMIFTLRNKLHCSRAHSSFELLIYIIGLCRCGHLPVVVLPYSVLPAGFDVLWWAWQTCGGKFRRPDLGTFGHRCC